MAVPAPTVDKRSGRSYLASGRRATYVSRASCRYLGRLQQEVCFSTLTIMREKLSHPPVNELVIGVYFNPPLLDIYAHHVGILWQALRDRYPRVEQRDPIGNLFIEAPHELFPMARFWLVSKDDSHLVQVQRNALILNWRRRNTEYPSFEPVKAEFDRVFKSFSDFVHTINAEATITVERAELAYVNLVEPCEYWKSPADTSNVIPSYTQLATGTPATFAVQQSVNIDEKTSVTTAVRVATKVPDNVQVLHFEVRVVGALGGVSKTEADVWFSDAHELTGKTFRSITNTDIRQRYWNREATND